MISLKNNNDQFLTIYFSINFWGRADLIKINNNQFVFNQPNWLRLDKGLKRVFDENIIFRKNKVIRDDLKDLNVFPTLRELHKNRHTVFSVKDRLTTIIEVKNLTDSVNEDYKLICDFTLFFN